MRVAVQLLHTLLGKRAGTASSEPFPPVDDETFQFVAVRAILSTTERKVLLDLLDNSPLLRVPPRVRKLPPAAIADHLLKRWHCRPVRERLLWTCRTQYDLAVVRDMGTLTTEVVRDLVNQHSVIEAAWLVREAYGASGEWHDFLRLLPSKDRDELAVLLTDGARTLEVLTTEASPAPDQLVQEVTRLRRVYTDLEGRYQRLELEHQRVLGIVRQRRQQVRDAHRQVEDDKSLLLTAEDELRDLHRRLTEQEELHQRSLAELIEQYEGKLIAAKRKPLPAEAGPIESVASLPLEGRHVVVVGGETREQGYREAIYRLGGTCEVVSGLEKQTRIPSAIKGADVVIVNTAHVKHKASQLIEAHATPETLVVQCPNAGLSSFERVLRDEVLSRIQVRGSDHNHAV